MKMNLSYKTLAAIAFASILLIGCGSQENDSNDDQASETMVLEQGGGGQSGCRQGYKMVIGTDGRMRCVRI